MNRYREDYRLTQSLRRGTPLDMDVYGAAVWSAVSPLSERSIAGRNQPVHFPDFTRGGWKKRQSLGIVTAYGGRARHLCAAHGFFERLDRPYCNHH